MSVIQHFTTGESMVSYFSQFREDRILEKIFPGKDTGTCVEVSAHDGITGSNTYYFERKGWNAFWSSRSRMLRAHPAVPHRAGFNCAASSGFGEATFHVAESVESWSALDLTESQKEFIRSGKAAIREIRVIKRTLDDMLTEAGISAIDFVSIDVEGHELDVLKGFSLDRFRPKIIIVEDNSHIAEGNVRGFLEGKGYKNFFRTGVNDWYARENDPILGPESIARLGKYLAQYEFEDRINQRLHFLNGLLPVSVKNVLSTALRYFSRGAI
jgi:FkbM family methyltransferase